MLFILSFRSLNTWDPDSQVILSVSILSYNNSFLLTPIFIHLNQLRSKILFLILMCSCFLYAILISLLTLHAFSLLLFFQRIFEKKKNNKTLSTQPAFFPSYLLIFERNSPLGRILCVWMFWTNGHTCDFIIRLWSSLLIVSKF